MVETPKTSMTAHFWGWLMLEKGQNPEDEQSCSFSGDAQQTLLTSENAAYCSISFNSSVTRHKTI